MCPTRLNTALSLVQVHVEGVIRESEKPSSFVPENSPSKAEWYWVDVPAMARAAGLPPDTPLIEAKSPRPPLLIEFCLCASERLQDALATWLGQSSAGGAAMHGQESPL